MADVCSNTHNSVTSQKVRQQTANIRKNKAKKFQAIISSLLFYETSSFCQKQEVVLPERSFAEV
jgi:hypothetical protein